MDKGMDSFFAKLKRLAMKVDKQVVEYKQAITESQSRQEFCAPEVLKQISDLRKEVKDARSSTLSELDKCRQRCADLDAVLTAGNTMFDSQSKKLAETEQFLTKYGLMPYDECKQDKEEKGCIEEQEEVTKEEIKEENTPKKSCISRDPKHTPRLEDAGISQETLQYLNSLQKVRPGKENVRPSFHKPSWANIPSAFQHDGLICTPSLTASLNITYNAELHEALASPVPYSAINEDQALSSENNLPNCSSRLQFDSTRILDSPKTPVFCTPGMKQILSTTITKEPHTFVTAVNKPHASVGLFQTDENYKSKTEARGISNLPNCMNEPDEPELTYSLEELSEMTGMFRINPVKPMVRCQNDYNKEIVTPPEPGLLSDRIGKINLKKELDLEKVEKEFQPRQKLISEMPPSPKFMLDYDFLKK